MDGTFHMARSARMGAKNGGSESDSDQGEDKIGIGQHYKKPEPEPGWLQESKINAAVPLRSQTRKAREQLSG